MNGWRPVAGPVGSVNGSRLGTLGRAVCTALVRPCRNPGPCSLKCDYRSLLSQGLSVGAWVSGGWGVSVQSGASPRCSLARTSELPVRDVGKAAVGEILSPRRAIEGVENLVRQYEALLNWLSLPQSDVAGDSVATRLFSSFL